MDKPNAQSPEFGKVERALADNRPTIPHDQVITEVRAAIAASAKRKTLAGAYGALAAAFLARFEAFLGDF